MQLCGFAAGFGREFLEGLERRLDIFWTFPERDPPVPAACHPLQCAFGHAADENRRPRLLYRLRNEFDIVELEVAATITRRVLRPQRLQDINRLVGAAPAFGERHAQSG